MLLRRLHSLRQEVQRRAVRRSFALVNGASGLPDSYLIFPVRIPLFPQTTLVTKVSQDQFNMLSQLQSEYVTAFLTKQAALSQEDVPRYEPPVETSTEAQEEAPATTGEVFSAGRRRGRKPSRFQSFAEDTLGHEESHPNIIYDELIRTGETELSQNEYISRITTIDDIFRIGSLCQLTLQSVPNLQDMKKLDFYAVLRAITRVRILEQLKGVPAHYIGGSLEGEAQRRAGMFIFGKQGQPAEEEKKGPVVSESVRNQISQTFLSSRVQLLNTVPEKVDEATAMQLEKLLKVYAHLKQKVGVNIPDVQMTSPADVVDIMCGFLSGSPYIKKSELQLQLLEALPLKERLDKSIAYLKRYERAFMEIWNSLQRTTNVPVDTKHAKKQLEEMLDYLKKNTQAGGGAASASRKPFVEKIRKALAERAFPENIRRIISDELAKIEEMSESHPEFNIARQTLELLIELPFGVTTQDNFDVENARKILDEDHYGLEEVKQRILEFIAVASLKQSVSGKTMLLVGPPGVGKTSICSSIARALGRKFVRIALGGEHDVAVIKGHRRTYMGAYPGKLVQALKNVGSENPVILLDEIDKITRSFRGNLQDALLEVLDPTQNNKFVDHYVDTPIDLSKVLFICSANLTDTIYAPLIDRMEVIRLSGYTTEEKKHILSQYLLPKAMKDAGLLDKFKDKVVFEEAAISRLLNEYCREAGVRTLERFLKRLCEKVGLQFLTTNISEARITAERLPKLIGPPVFTTKRMYDGIPPAGVVIGLAYNSYGGNILYIEAIKANWGGTEQVKLVGGEKEGHSVIRKGSLKLTGSLGDVMQESVQIAYSYAKYVLSTFLNNHFLEVNDVHIHFPEGASKKDGPSAGVAITTSLISLALNEPMVEEFSMTGEISLTGKVLKIGGVKEKVMAAKREGVKRVILPLANQAEFERLEDYIKEGVVVNYADIYFDVLKLIFPQVIKTDTSFVTKQATAV